MERVRVEREMSVVRRRWLLIVVCLVILCVGSGGNYLLRADEDRVGVAIAAMIANDSLLSSYSGTCTITTRRSIEARERSMPVNVRMAQSDIVAEASPEFLPETQTEIFDVTALGPKIRVGHEVREGSGVDGSLISQRQVEIWDGERLSRVTPPAQEGSYSGVFVTTKDKPTVGLVPFYTALFPWHEARSESFRDNKVAWVGVEEIEGRQVWVLQWTPSDPEFSNIHIRYWLDLKRGCLPLKEEVYTDGRDTPTSRMTYGDLTSYGDLWLPLSATREVYSPNNEVFESSEIRTVRLDVNQEIPKEIFTVDLPLGTALWDDDLGTGRWVK